MCIHRQMIASHTISLFLNYSSFTDEVVPCLRGYSASVQKVAYVVFRVNMFRRELADFCLRPGSLLSAGMDSWRDSNAKLRNYVLSKPELIANNSWIFISGPLIQCCETSLLHLSNTWMLRPLSHTSS
ncbi:hypothetical protein HZ326_24735 [Fusarium oxysporum f. sp. albedinis]|nr:hypothetical protein HZ326_24735 [Fusarium oxysporum f. sp. albedinis]